MFGVHESIAIINWDGVLQPRSASPRQILNAIIAFAELYLWQWNDWLITLPAGLKQAARMTIIAANIPRVIALYSSASVQKAINDLKLGQKPEADFFDQLLPNHFSFLLTCDLSSAELPSNISQPEKAKHLIKRAWCHPRIQDLTPLELARFAEIMKTFDKVFLISNSNPPDIRCFIDNIIRSGVIPDIKPKNVIFTELEQLLTSARARGTSKDILGDCLHLSDELLLVASSLTGEWKVKTGKSATDTGSEGFLLSLLNIMVNNKITVVSNAPSDLGYVRRLQRASVIPLTGSQYFRDQHQLQKFAMDVYDNWPILTALMFGLVTIYLLSSFR